MKYELITEKKNKSKCLFIAKQKHFNIITYDIEERITFIMDFDSEDTLEEVRQAFDTVDNVEVDKRWSLDDIEEDAPMLTWKPF